MDIDPRAGTAPTPVGSSRSTQLIGYVVAFLLGALFGILGTIVHQISFSVFGLFDLPIGIVVALPAEALLLLGLRLVAPTRLASILAAVALVGIVSLLALPSPGGSVLIPDSTAGMVWLVGSALVAVIVIAWPRLQARRPERRQHRSEAVDLISGSKGPEPL